MNELHDEFADKGLTIIGVTDEGKKPTEDWIAKKAPKYAYAYDKKGELSRWFGIRGIPHAVLVDPVGTVVWRGHPGQLSKKTVEEHLAGALASPVYEWPKSLAGARKALLKGDFAKALAEASSDAEVTKALQGMVARQMRLLRERHAAKDYLGALELGESLTKKLDGLPEEVEVEQVLASIQGDEITAIVKAQRKVRKLMDGKIKSREIERIEKELKDLRREFAGTGAGADAERALDRLIAMRARR